MSSNASWWYSDAYFIYLANPDLTQTPKVIYSKLHKKFYPFNTHHKYSLNRLWSDMDVFISWKCNQLTLNFDIEYIH